jgi:ComF family protein
MDLLWPPRTACLLCHGALEEQGQELPGAASARSGAPGLVCQLCWHGMAFHPGLPRCGTCARPVPGAEPQCVDCEESAPYGQVYAVGTLMGPLREAIHHLKFGGREVLATALGQHLGALHSLPPVCLVPVPLHRSRLRERGYNQAALIARGIAAVSGGTVVEHGLVRLRSTGHQAKLDRHERLENLQAAFGVSSPNPVWFGRDVLLVDDVLTTGATAVAVRTQLLASGARRVDLAVLAVSATPVSGNRKNHP